MIAINLSSSDQLEAAAAAYLRLAFARSRSLVQKPSTHSVLNVSRRVQDDWLVLDTFASTRWDRIGSDKHINMATVG